MPSICKRLVRGRAQHALASLDLGQGTQFKQTRGSGKHFWRYPFNETSASTAALIFSGSFGHALTMAARSAGRSVPFWCRNRAVKAAGLASGLSFGTINKESFSAFSGRLVPPCNVTLVLWLSVFSMVPESALCGSGPTPPVAGSIPLSSTKISLTPFTLYSSETRFRVASEIMSK